MKLLLIVLIVIVVITVTLVLVRLKGIGGSGMSEEAYLSKKRGDALEERYQAEQQDGGPGSR